MSEWPDEVRVKPRRPRKTVALPEPPKGYHWGEPQWRAGEGYDERMVIIKLIRDTYK